MSDAAVIDSGSTPPAPVPAPRRAVMMPVAIAELAGSPRWLVTFADLVALLVAFFVMILSMSSFDADAVARLNGAATAGIADKPAPATGSPLTPEADLKTGAGARYLASVLLGQLAVLGADRGVTVDTQDAGVVMVLPDTVFSGGIAGRELAALLDRLAAAAPGRITVFGAAVTGDSAGLFDAARATVPANPGIGAGAAGWLERGQVAIAIRNPVSAGPAASAGATQ